MTSERKKRKPKDYGSIEMFKWRIGASWSLTNPRSGKQLLYEAVYQPNYGWMKSKECRRLAKWLLKAADYLDRNK